MTMLSPLPAPFINEAGKIQNLVELAEGGTAIRGVALIHSKAGARRSSHRHASDWHYLYVLRGSMLYTEQRVGSETVVKFRVKEGEMVHTGPNVDHWTEFDEDTVLISMSRLSRSHAEHEADLTRVPWIETANDNAEREQA